MNDFILEQIDKYSIIKHNRELFRSLCGIDIEIHRRDGESLRPASSQAIPDHIRASIKGDHQPRVYPDMDGLQRIVIPIIMSQDIAGYITTGETKDFPLTQDQIETVTPILVRFAEYVVSNEIEQYQIAFESNDNLTRQQELLQRAVKYIRNNYHSNDLTLKDVSVNNGISYHYLSRIFKKELDTTFAQFRNKVRMEAAKRMLQNRQLSVSKISYECGFDDPAYFCKVFKNSFGISPSTFRNQHRFAVC